MRFRYRGKITYRVGRHSELVPCGAEAVLLERRKVSAAPQGIGCHREPPDGERYVGLFLLSECVFEPGGWLSRSAFREIFEKWCSEEGIHRAPTGRRISIAFRERGVSEGPA